MKLAICSVGELFGGVETHILGMGTWLRREGHEFHLVLFHDRELAKQARGLGFDPVILGSRGPFDPTAVRRLGRLFTAEGIDVVHAHGYRAVVHCALARTSHRFGMVRTLHGLVEQREPWSWKGLKSRVYTWAERQAGRRAGAAVVYVTEDLRKRHRAVDVGLDTRTIHNGIDPLDQADRQLPPELDPDILEILAVGRISEVKGLTYAVQAMEGLETSGQVRLNLVGKGPEEENLRAEVRARGLEDRVRFLGFKDNVYDYLAHADLLLMPSLHEGAPYTVLESMSLGLPVLCSRTGGLPELLEEGVSGRFVAVGDVDGLRRAIADLAADPDSRSRLSEEARLRYTRMFDLETMGTSYWNLFHEVTGKDEAP